MTRLTEAVNEVSLMARAVSSCTQPPARPHVSLAHLLSVAREGRVPAAGTLAATVQKVSVRIVHLGGGGGDQ